MADSRCVNPEYQLDVDVMILEYTLHKTVEAQLRNLGCQIEELSDDASDGFLPSEQAIEERDTSHRLQQTCDDLISLFRHHHPSTAFSLSCHCNLRLLEFLILLEHWIQLSSRTLLGSGSNWMLPNRYRPNFAYPQQRPDNLVQQFSQARAVETVLRRNWLGIRYDDEQSSYNPEDSVNHKKRKLSHNTTREDHDNKKYDHDQQSNSSTINGVSTDSNHKDSAGTLPNPANEERPCLNAGIVSGNKRLEVSAKSRDVVDYLEAHSLFSITLFELMPLFMDLSADLSNAMGNINERWIELAIDFMWQSALERLQQMPDAQYTKPSEDAFKEISEDFGMRTWVEECFAWGSIPDISEDLVTRIKQELKYIGATSVTDAFIQDRLRSENHISKMLTKVGNDDKNGNMNGNDQHVNKSSEYAQWSQKREQQLTTLLNLVIEEKPVSEHTPFYVAVRRLCDKSPIKLFLNALLEYLESAFHVNFGSDTPGKPILVQIEEGGLQGLSDEEFIAFLDRVGLKVSNIGTPFGGVVVRWSR